jgi:hypothetical protein
VNGKPFVAGVSLTVLLHAALVVVTVTNGESLGCGGGAGAEASTFEEAEVIEAALAFKKVSPKDKQPQKQKMQKYAPVDAPRLSNDATQLPEDKPEDPKIAPTPEEIDPASVLKKNRAQDEDLSSTGVDELPREGADDGSEWGTERDAKGDPYVGELVGRIKSAWAVPTLETGSGTAVGCVRLSRDGSINDRELKNRSGNANVDRSVEEAMISAPAMEKPVPDELVQLLTVRGICINFKFSN